MTERELLLVSLVNYYDHLLKRLNMFLAPIIMSTFCFSPSKQFFQLLVPKKFSIFIFGPSFKANSYIEFIFFNKFLLKKS